MARRLAAILAADVVGYSRLMAADEAGTHARLKALRQDFIEPKIAEHHGRIVKLMGDGALVEFVSVVDALECAAAIQKGVAERQAELPEDRRIAFRIGMNIGDVIIEDDDIYGDGVNVAARLEALAEPGEICVSRTVYNHAKSKVAFAFEPMGAHRVKNIPEPVTVYRVITDPGSMAKVLGLNRAGARTWRSGALAAAAIVLLVAGGAGLWLRSHDDATPEPQQAKTSVATSDATGGAEQVALDKRRIAVLPFTNISADPEDEYFSDGMTEELISKLSRLRDLKVIARTSVMRYKETDRSIAEIGRELGVGTVLEGSVRKAGDRLRITTQLVDVASEGHLWSQDYERTLDDVFAIQGDVAQNVADALEVTLGPGEKKRFDKQQTQNFDAYNSYVKGLYHWHKLTKENLNKARRYFEQAIEFDPTYASSYAWLAYSYQVLGEFGHMPANEAYPRAKDMALKAIEIDATAPEAYSVLATIRAYYDWDWAASEVAYKKAIELNPNNVVAHWNYGILLLTPLSRHDEAIAELELALELEPLAPWIGADLAWAFNHATRFDEAIAASQAAIDLDPSFPHPHESLGYAFLQTGRYEEAIAEFQKQVELTGEAPYAMARLGWAYSVAGRKGETQKILVELERRSEREHVDPLVLAWLYIGLKNKEEAFAWLEKAYEEKSSWLIFINSDKLYDPLRSDPRFTRLLGNIGLERG